MTITPQIIRLQQVIELLNTSKSTVYKQVNNGTFPKPISMGDRAVAWVTSEVNKVINARIKGFTDKQLQQLVIELKTKRGEL